MSHAVASSGARILLARPDHLGDVLLTLPAVMALRSALPDATISYLVADSVASIPRHCPAVDMTLTVPFPSLSSWPDVPGWADVVSAVAPTLRGRFDLAILPRLDDHVSGALVAAADVPIRLGYNSPLTRPYLTHALPLPGRRHVASTTADLARAATEILGTSTSTDTGEAPCFVPTDQDEAEAAAVLGSLPLAGESGPFVLHPGSGWPIKNWLPSRWGQVAAAIAVRYRVAPLVTGGPGEGALVRAVVDASGGRARGLAGRLSIGGLAALFRRAHVVIATDGGPLHLAAMLGTPVVGLYGPADPIEFGPWCYANRRRIVRVHLPCSPCRTLDRPPCGDAVEPRCIRTITTEAVFEAIADLLSAGGRRCFTAPGHRDDDGRLSAMPSALKSAP
jgi:ADP-heptose:LPS heptosyltransferase